jgi:hypothetical protein
LVVVQRLDWHWALETQLEPRGRRGVALVVVVVVVVVVVMVVEVVVVVVVVVALPRSQKTEPTLSLAIAGLTTFFR